MIKLDLSAEIDNAGFQTTHDAQPPEPQPDLHCKPGVSYPMNHIHVLDVIDVTDVQSSSHKEKAVSDTCG